MRTRRRDNKGLQAPRAAPRPPAQEAPCWPPRGERDSLLRSPLVWRPAGLLVYLANGQPRRRTRGAGGAPGTCSPAKGGLCGWGHASPRERKAPGAAGEAVEAPRPAAAGDTPPAAAFPARLGLGGSWPPTCVTAGAEQPHGGARPGKHPPQTRDRLLRISGCKWPPRGASSRGALPGLPAPRRRPRPWCPRGGSREPWSFSLSFFL